MGEIYAGAERVEIWLGPDEDGSEAAIRSIGRQDADAMAEFEFTDALTKLIQRPWFTRDWIMQEVALCYQMGA